MTDGMEYFDGRANGFRFVMPSVLLGGPTTDTYSPDDSMWHVTYQSAGRRWEGVGASLVAAYLDMIAQRMAVEPGEFQHRPSRDSDVAAWIKRARDEWPQRSGEPSGVEWEALNSLLDDYREHADTGTPLGQEVQGPGGDDA